MNSSDLYTSLVSSLLSQKSDAFKAGLLIGIESVLGDEDNFNDSCPFENGSSEADAWCSGMQEGKSRADEYKLGWPLGYFDSWSASSINIERTFSDSSEPSKRITFDIRESLHRRIKADCASRGITIADLLRSFLEMRFS